MTQQDDRVMGMPLEEDIKDLDKQGKGFTPNFGFYSMMPKEDGQIADNRLYFAMFRPHKFTHFDKSFPEDLWTFYLPVMIHYIFDPVNGRTIPVFCSDGINDYMKKFQLQVGEEIVTGLPETFPGDKCIYCSMEQGWWKKANERREQIGGRTVPYEVLKQDQDWVSLRAMAKSFTKSKRFYFLVLDLDKLEGKKSLAENEQIQMQLLGGPENILKGLNKKKALGYAFWNLKEPYVVIVNRDNTDGAKKAKYQIDISKDPVTFPQEVVDLILAEDLYPDLGLELVYQSKEAQLELLTARNDDLSVLPAPSSAPQLQGSAQPQAQAQAVKPQTLTNNTEKKETTLAPATLKTSLPLKTNKEATPAPVAETPAEATPAPAEAEATPAPAEVTPAPAEATPAEATPTPDATDPANATTPIKSSQTLLEKIAEAKKTKKNGVEIGGKQFKSF
jgi:hypothetical protein